MTTAFARLDPRTRLLGCVVLGTSVATLPPLAWTALVLHALAIIAAVTASRPGTRWLARRLGAIAVVALVIAWLRTLSLVRPDASVMLDGAGRITLAMAALLPLAWSLSPTQFAHALALLRLPAGFVSVTAATARGIAILGQQAERVARARALRAPDGGVAMRVTLFGSYVERVVSTGLRRAEHAQLAMDLRGFDGVTRHESPTPWPSREWLALAAGAVIAVGTHWLP